MIRELENAQRHVFGALRFVDEVTGAPVSGTLRVTSPDVELSTNRSGLFVLRRFAPGVVAPYMSEAEQAEFVHTRRYQLLFDNGNALPNSVSFALTVSDPAGRYLERACALRLVAQPADAAAQGPFDRALMPSPSARPGPGHAVIRVSVVRNGRGVPGALVDVQRVGSNTVIARSTTDAVGEALVLVGRLPVSTWTDTDNDGIVDAGEITTGLSALRVRLTVDEDTLDPSGTLKGPPEPDRILFASNRTRRTSNLSAAPGATHKVVFDLT